MSPRDHLGTTLEDLSLRLEASGRLAGWAQTEPALADLPDLAALARRVQDRQHPAAADELVGALVRLGAADGGDDQDAVIAVALLLDNGAARVARQLRDLSPDIDALVAGQLWLQVRDFPWRRRHRAFAKSILLDARRALLRDLGAAGPGHGEVVVQMFAPDLVEWLEPDLGLGEPAPELTLGDVLEWATGEGIVADHDAALLLELVASGERHAERHGGTVRGLNCTAEVEVVAQARGVAVKTIRRHRDRALACLQHAASAYVTDCA